MWFLPIPTAFNGRADYKVCHLGRVPTPQGEKGNQGGSLVFLPALKSWMSIIESQASWVLGNSTRDERPANKEISRSVECTTHSSPKYLSPNSFD